MTGAPWGLGARRPARCWAGLLFCAAAACASPAKRDPDRGMPLVAVLPMANQSVNIEAPDKVRPVLMEAMMARGYRLVPSPKLDASLKELGFNGGDQLGALDLGRLKAKEPADWYCYGTVEDFVFKSAVALSQKKVTLRLKIVEAASGMIVFDAVESGVTTSAGVQAAGDLALNMVGKVAKAVKNSAKQVMPGQTLKSAADATDQVADVDMGSETREAVRKLMEKMDQVRFPAR